MSPLMCSKWQWRISELTFLAVEPSPAWSAQTDPGYMITWSSMFTSAQFLTARSKMPCFTSYTHTVRMNSIKHNIGFPLTFHSGSHEDDVCGHFLPVSHFWPTQPAGHVHFPSWRSHTPSFSHSHLCWQSAPKKPGAHSVKKAERKKEEVLLHNNVNIYERNFKTHKINWQVL